MNVWVLHTPWTDSLGAEANGRWIRSACGGALDLAMAACVSLQIHFLEMSRKWSLYRLCINQVSIGMTWHKVDPIELLCSCQLGLMGLLSSPLLGTEYGLISTGVWPISVGDVQLSASRALADDVPSSQSYLLLPFLSLNGEARIDCGTSRGVDAGLDAASLSILCRFTRNQGIQSSVRMAIGRLLHCGEPDSAADSV